MIYTKQEFEVKIKSITKNISYPHNLNYVHTHVHSECSFLDGAGKISELAKKCKELDMPLVITDHGNVAATIKAFQASKKEGIPFIRGMEAYIRKDEEDGEEDYEGNYFHLILLPYTKEGFENINILSSLAYIKGVKYVAKRAVPVISKEWLKEYGKGIVAMSACMFGEISANIWLHYPYIELLNNVNPKFAMNILNDARTIIREKKVLTKKSGLTVDDLNDEDILNIILQKKKLNEIKDMLMNEVNKYSNEEILAVAKNNPNYLNNITNIIKYYMNIFDFFYLEIQDHNFFEQRLTTLIQQHIVKTNDIGTKLVITNDVHYIEKTDWEVQDVLLCISTKKTLNDKTRFKFKEHELYFKTSDELLKMFPYLTNEEKREYMKNSTEIVKICLNYQIALDEMFYPKFEIPSDFKTSSQYLIFLCIEGARLISKHMPKDFRYRIFNIIEYKNMRDIMIKNIDFKTAFKLVKDEKKQSQIIPKIQQGIENSAEEILKSSLRVKNISENRVDFNKYKEAIERVIYELSIIFIKEISDYFLITKQIIDFARNDGILTGPGRGSAAGSTVAYLLGITELDPLDYNLYFERFINPERNSYPDIDSDFPQRYLKKIRESTYEYFGIENCCGVNAFGNIKRKRAVQDSFRVFDFEANEINKISKEISNEIPIIDSIMRNSNYKKRYMEEDTEENPNIFKKAVDMAEKITGNIRQAGTHAAGMIITPKSLNMFKHLPVMITGGNLNSQYDKNDIEYAGFLKIDLLGIRNLDIIQDALEYIKKYRNKDINIAAIPLNDEKTFQLYRDADTSFVFQVESKGMQEFLRRIQPRNIEDIITIVAGYRPGPMPYLESYVKVRNGEEEAVYRHELMKPILEVTCGISFYQEQIMEIFKSLAGYSLGRADLVRRALGKKKKEILDEERHNFIYGIQAKDDEQNLLFEADGKTPIMEVKGCINNGISEEVANQIYNDILPFADYGFNKSHAAGYAILSYRTAYLKANYFLEYATAVLKSVQENKNKLSEYANIIKSKGVKILFPNINTSNVNMDIYDFENKIIITGLMTIKGLSEQVAQNIVLERETNGKFENYENFIKRMFAYGIDKKSINALIDAGTFDDFDKDFNRLLNYYEYLNQSLRKIEEVKKSNHNTIFDLKIFEKPIDYLKYIPDSTGYSLVNRFAKLCEANNIGIHNDIITSYKNINFNLITKRYQKDDDYIVKEGIVTGILEDEFTISKKGKAYLTTFRTFNGDIYKIIVSRFKVDDVTNDITQYKKGNVVDITGTFKFPKINEEESNSDEYDDIRKFDDIICFPRDIKVKALEQSFICPKVVINLDELVFERKMIENYFGESDVQNIMTKLFAKKSPDNLGKEIILRKNGNTYKILKGIDVSLADIHKLGYEWKLL